MYSTPNLLGVSLEASYNEDKGWSAGASFSGFPAMKDVSIAVNAGYHSIGEDASATSLGVSGGVKHNASGFNINGSWGNQDVKGGATAVAWMVDGGWTGKVTDAGNTSINVGYGVWGDGVLGESTRYHFIVNQNVATAATDVYLGVSYDSGEYTHTVAHTPASVDHDLDAEVHEFTAAATDSDMTCGADAANDDTCAASRDGVFTVIAGVLLKF